MNSLPTTLSGGIRLRDILPTATIIGNEDVVIQSACGRWNECQPSDVFVAVDDADGDGHDYAPEAIRRGAAAAVGERLMAISHPQFLVDDSRTAYGAICQALAGSPSQRLRTCGVAGSDGKTVTAHLIDSILQAAGLKSGLASSISSESQPNNDQQIHTPEIAQQLNAMAMQNCSHGVIEVHSTGLARHAYAGLGLDSVVITNLGRRNLAFHGSSENEHRAIARSIDYLKSGGMAVVNGDDRDSLELLDSLSVPAITFGVHRQAEVMGRLIDRSPSCQTFMLMAGVESIPVQTSIVGKQHVYNCLAAAAAGLSIGLELETIARGLETAKIPGRLERIECGQPFGVWVDSALTPTQLSTAASAVSRVSEGRLWCICSTDSSQSTAERKHIGSILERKTERAVVTQTSIGLQTDYEPSHQILDGMEEPAKARIMPDRIQAIHWVLDQAKSGDAVLIAGCGERQFATNGETGELLRDQDVCRARLTDLPQQQISAGPNIFNIADYS